jgi:hypothetical protein
MNAKETLEWVAGTTIESEDDVFTTVEIIEAMDTFAKSEYERGVAELPDNTREMLEFIYKWELDSGNPYSLESLLRENYIISKRKSQSGKPEDKEKV